MGCAEGRSLGYNLSETHNRTVKGGTILAENGRFICSQQSAVASFILIKLIMLITEAVPRCKMLSLKLLGPNAFHMKKATLAGQFLKVKELHFGLDDEREQRMGVVAAAWLVDVQHYQLQVSNRTIFHEDNTPCCPTWQFFLVLSRAPDILGPDFYHWRNGGGIDPLSVIRT